ncbi:MAG: hypothetical protein AB7S38_39715 [Vulcanimicrobiota bacterium]
MVRLLLLASLLLLLLAVGAEVVSRPRLEPGPPVTAGPEDLLIVPGQRVGFIMLGLAVSELENKLGKSIIRPAHDAQLHVYPEAGISLSTRGGHIVSILVKNPQFKTRSGIGVGSDVDAVMRTFSEHYEYEGDEKHYNLHYWAVGIHFLVEEDHISTIQITEPML